MAGRDGEKLDRAITQTAVDSGRAMSSAMKGAGGDSGEGELYRMNQVYYRSIPSLSAVTKRTLNKCNFQLPGYTNLQQQTLTTILNVGADFINGRQSWLIFQLGIKLPTTYADNPKNYDVHAFLPQCGAVGIIDEVWLESSTGTEICREQNKGLYMEHYLLNTLPPESIRRNGIQAGMAEENASNLYSGRGYCRAALAEPTYAGPIYNRHGAYASGGDDATATGDLLVQRPPILNDQGAVDITYVTEAKGGRVATTPLYFAIPLDQLLGCFKPYMDSLLPGIMIAGATLKIRIKNLIEPLTITGSGIQYNATADTDAARLTYARDLANTATIDDIYLLLDSYTMNDSVVRKINEIAATRDGLTLMYDTFDWSSTPVTGLSVEAQVSQARSRIQCSWCVVRDQAAISNPYVPSLQSEGASNRLIGPYAINQQDQLQVTSFQSILGSMYFPNQVMKTAIEYYVNQLYIFGKIYKDEKDCSCVSYEDFLGASGSEIYNDESTPLAPTSSIDWAFPYGSAVFGFTAERSSLLALTGLTISNARLLRHRITFNDAPVSLTNRIIDVFTIFTRMAKVFSLGRIVVKE